MAVVDSENVVSEFLIMPWTFVMFVPVVKNKCVNWTGHRRGSLERLRGLQFTMYVKSRKMSRSRSWTYRSPSQPRTRNRRSRSRFELKIKVSVSESHVSFTSLHACISWFQTVVVLQLWMMNYVCFFSTTRLA